MSEQPQKLGPPTVMMHGSLVIGYSLPTNKEATNPAVMDGATLVGVFYREGWKARPRLRRLGVTVMAARAAWKWWPAGLAEAIERQRVAESSVVWGGWASMGAIAWRPNEKVGFPLEHGVGGVEP